MSVWTCLAPLMVGNKVHYLFSPWWPPKPPLPLPIPCVSVLLYGTRTRIPASVRWRYTAVRWSSRHQTWLCCYWWSSGGMWSDRLEREPMTSQRLEQDKLLFLTCNWENVTHLARFIIRGNANQWKKAKPMWFHLQWGR